MVAKIEMDPSEPTMTSSSIPFPNNFFSEWKCVLTAVEEGALSLM